MSDDQVEHRDRVVRAIIAQYRREGCACDDLDVQLPGEHDGPDSIVTVHHERCLMMELVDRRN